MAINRLYVQSNQMLPNASVTPGAGALGSAAVTGDPVLVGKIPGVMMGNADAAGTGIVQIDGIFNLSVKGVDANGNAAVAYGATIYFTAADTPPLSVKATGTPFGHALAGVASGATTTTPVQVGRKS